VQRKQQVGECWVCVIFFAQVVVSERLRRARRGVRGGGTRPPLGGCRGFGGVQCPQIFFFFWDDIFPRHIFGTTYFRTTYYRDDIFPGPHDIRWFFGTWFFADGFLFPVKELGFWTNPGHWVRVLDAAGSYMYIVL
jgi:hypothetical protein